MATLTRQIQDCTVTSVYQGTTENAGGGVWETWYTTPSTGKADVYLDCRGIPAGSTIKSATLHWTANQWTAEINNSTNRTLNVKSVVEVGQNKKVIARYKDQGNGIGQSPPSLGQTKTYSISCRFYDMTLEVEYDPPYSSGTLDKTEVDCGQDITLTVHPQSSSYTHKATFYLDGFAEGSAIDIPQSNSLTYTVPTAWMNDMPNVTRKKAYAKILTYNGSTLLGSKALSFYVNVPASVVPTITDFTVSRIDDEEHTVGVYASGHSRASILATVLGAMGSSVQQVLLNGVSVTFPYETSVLQDGQKNFRIDVTDSRGRTASAEQSITVFAYDPPQMAVSYRRVDDGGVPQVMGTKVQVQAVVSCTEIGNNTVTAFVKAGNEASIGLASGVWTLLDVNLPIGESLALTFYATDHLMTVVKNELVPTSRFPIHFKNGGLGVAFGQVSHEDECVQIADGWKLKLGDVNVMESICNLSAVNLLDNSDFTIAQAGYSGQHNGVTYACDRWKLVSGTFTALSGGGYEFQGEIMQRLESPPYGDSTAFVGVLDGEADITVSGDTVTITSDGCTLLYAAVYAGCLEQEPPYVRPHPAVETEKCMRYYVNMDENCNMMGYGYTQRVVQGHLSFPVYMRDTPTVTVKEALYYDGGFQTGGTVSSSFVNRAVFSARITMENNTFTVGRAYGMRVKFEAVADIE